MPPGRFSPVMRPGDGVNVSGFSALMRHSMAWPRHSTGRSRISASLSPAAMRIWALHQVDAGDHLGDRMLHLDARVHLDEVEVALLIHQEFDGAGVGVADGADALRKLSPRRGRAVSALKAGDGDSSSSF